MTIFHILDSISQDIVKDGEAEAPVNDPVTDDEDPEVYSRRRRPEGKKKFGDFAKQKMVIHLFGTTAEGASLRCTVEGFRPFFFVKLPSGTPRAQTEFSVKLNQTLERRGLRGLVETTYEQRKVLYGYTADKDFPFARLSVPSLAAFRSLKKVFLDPEYSTPIFKLREDGPALEVYEANLDPMLRFFHLRDIKPCGWVETTAEPEKDEDTGNLILDTDWDEIRPTVGPVAAAPFLLAAWDIECYSENGEFPLARKGYDRLAKQLYSAAESAEEAAELILHAAVYPESPLKGMDPLRRRGGKPINRDALEEALQDPKFLDEIRPLFLKREGLSVTARDDRIFALRAALGKKLTSQLSLAGDPVIQIGVVLVRNGAPTEKHIFVLGSCAPVEGATVYAYDDTDPVEAERRMIKGWAQKMQDWNPDILVGYNIFGFDEKYLWERAKELGISSHPTLQSLTRLGDKEKTMDLEEKFLSSSALGDNTMWIWSAHGRLQVDLFHYIKRSFSLPAYKLDYVCQHFMSGKLGGVDCGPDSWFLKTKTTSDVVIGRYVVLLDETGDMVVDKLRILDVKPKEGLIVEAPKGDDAADLAAATPDAVKWAVVKDDVSPQDIFKLQRGSAEDRAKVAAYCVQDCDLVVELYKKLDVFNNAMAMANACSVPVGYIFTRGQGVKIESLIFKECYNRKQCIVVMPTQPRRSEGAEEGGGQEESYEGAIVLTPKPGFYFKSPIGVADFASLYPSTIISENISHDTLVWVKNYDMNGNFLGFELGSEEAEKAVRDGVARADRDGTSRSGTGNEVSWTDIEFDIWGVKEGDTRKQPEKEKKGLRVCRYAQFPGDVKGTLPEIVQGLLKARKDKRKEAEKETDPFKKALLDAEQLAYKLTANSLYGQLGSATFKVRLQHLAASVTAYGRKQIMFAKDAIERFYGPAAGRADCAAETVYGDTDSLFINFNVRNPATGALLEGREAIVATQHLTEEAGKLVTTCLKPPHDFEYDKVFSPFIIFSKKRYVGNKYEESPDDYYQNSMGIATKRRDYAGIVKVIYGGAIRILLSERDPIKAANFVQDKLMELAEGRASTTQLTMSKSLRSEYKSATPPAHKILADRIAARDPGNAPASGDRISFLYIQPAAGQVAAKSQGERIETPAWIKQHKLEIDAKFYMEHQLMNPISQLFALIVEDLPGCAAPGGKAWSAASESDREYAAAEYLFREALNACDKGAQRRFAQKFFGGAAPAAGAGLAPPRRSPRVAAAANSTEAPPAAPAAPKQQMKMSMYLLQELAIKKLDEEKKKSQKAKKEKAALALAATKVIKL